METKELSWQGLKILRVKVSNAEVGTVVPIVQVTVTS